MVTTEKTLHTKTAELEILDFSKKLGQHLSQLLIWLKSDKCFLKKDPVWKDLIPFHKENYGNSASIGHCIRPDIIKTEAGFKVCELDFSPSGRGYISRYLEEKPEEQKLFLSAFADWYKKMGAQKFLYATATITVCEKEAAYFCSSLKKYFDINIVSGNIDHAIPRNRVIDRLFYRSELCNEEKLFRNNSVITSEPYLDSKAIFALFHTPEISQKIRRSLGDNSFIFLKSVFPETHLLENPLMNGKIIESIIHETNLRNQWLIKSGDVEENNTWGSRSVVVGKRTSAKEFIKILTRKDSSTGNGRSKKIIHNFPLLQSFEPTVGMEKYWNDCAHGTHAFSSEQDAITPTERGVYGRIGVYLLINSNNPKEVIIPRYGCMTLRHNEPLAHGSRDAVFVPFKIT